MMKHKQDGKRGVSRMAGVVLAGLMSAAAIGAKGAEKMTTADFYVAASGKDANPGTAKAQFATVAKARDAVRGKIKAGLTKDIIVQIPGGTYPVIETLTFGSQDSGTEKLSIAYRKVKCGEEMGGGGAPRESRNGGIVARKRR